jgi:hypothetical protein
MQNNIPVVPGIVPMLPNEIKQLFYKMGEKQVVTKGFCGAGSPCDDT